MNAWLLLAISTVSDSPRAGINGDPTRGRSLQWSSGTVAILACRIKATRMAKPPPPPPKKPTQHKRVSRRHRWSPALGSPPALRQGNRRTAGRTAAIVFQDRNEDFDERLGVLVQAHCRRQRLHQQVRQVALALGGQVPHALVAGEGRQPQLALQLPLGTVGLGPQRVPRAATAAGVAGLTRRGILRGPSRGTQAHK